MASERTELLLDDDLISRMPNEILVYILELLKTKEAVNTSVLSTRWRDLFLHMSKFECTLASESRLINSVVVRSKVLAFTDSIYRIVSTHKNVRSLTLYLNFWNAICDEQLDMCVLSALNGKLEHLNLTNNSKHSYGVPISGTDMGLYDCLKNLELGNCSLILTPSFPTFRSVKELTLEDCIFFKAKGNHEEPEYMTEEPFLSFSESFPMLETLYLSHCTVPPVLTFDSSCLHLKQLTIYFSTVQEIKVTHAPKLEKLVCIVEGTLSILMLPNLKHLTLEILDCNVDISLDEISKNAPNLEELNLSFEWAWLEYDCSFPFRNLKSIIVNARAPYICNTFCIGLLLRAAPFVQKFLFEIHYYAEESDDEEMMEEPPEVYHIHLKELEIMGFNGVAETDVISFVMRRAKAIERVIFRCALPIEDAEVVEQIEAIKSLRDTINKDVQVQILDFDGLLM